MPVVPVDLSAPKAGHHNGPDREYFGLDCAGRGQLRCPRVCERRILHSMSNSKRPIESVAGTLPGEALSCFMYTSRR
jgi:hypothetical protein